MGNPLRQAEARLRAAGVDQARTEALLLLSSALGVDRTAILAHPDRALSVDDAKRFDEMVARRARREPFAQIVGRREFFGLDLVVDDRVLVPRPETETLVEQALQEIGRLAERGLNCPWVIDVGTGSGAIALAVAANSRVNVVASDVSGAALEVARANARALGLTDRVSFVRGDLLRWSTAQPDLVMANLPYLPSGRIDSLMPEVALREPSLALDGGIDGLALIRQLVDQAGGGMAPRGVLLLEMDPDQVDPLRSFAEGWNASVIGDLAGDDRVVRLESLA